MRLLAWLKWVACLATLAVAMGCASNAAAQYTVAPGASVAVNPCVNGCTAPPPDPDGPYSYSGAGGRGYYNAAADIYTAPTDWYGVVEIQFMWRSCATCGNPYLTYAGSVFITVAQPKPSITGGSMTVPYGGSKTHFFAPTNGGVVSIKSGPSHGTVELDFTAAIYRPNPGYVGPDSFVAVATNAAGESQPATVNVTVQQPPIPVLTGGNLNLPYGSSATHDFAPTHDGVLALVQSPINGVVTLSGGRATYTPNVNFVGSDTFGVTATNAGGTSNLMVVGVYVTPPPIPTLTGGNLALAFNAAGTHDFAPTSGGVLALASAAAHGTVTIDGGRATYTPNPDYIGPDSFGVTGTNPGGTSAVTTISVTVAPPPIPVLSGGSLALAFNTGGTHDFAPTSGGVLALVDAPANGTVSLSGGRATYTPRIDFIGSDSFGVTGTNLGGTSAVMTVAVTVAPPPIPVLTGGELTLAFNATGTHDFAPTSGGILALVNAPAHGVVSISGGRATYTPNPDFIGPDSFGVTGTNLGGTSAVASISVTVAPPPVPTLTGGSLALAFNTPGTHDFAPTERGVLALADAPAHGAVAISGGRVTYTPDQDYIGGDSFSVTATNLGGTSARATAAITVSPPDAPGAGSASLTTPYETVGRVLLPATGLYRSLAIVDQPEHGQVAIAAGEAVYTPDAGYFGVDSFSYQAIGLGGASGPASVAVTVGRPNAPVVANASAVTGHGAKVIVPLQVSGVYTALKVGVAPKNGTAVIDGLSVAYSPMGGFAGRETFTIIAEGPGGDSAAGEIAVLVNEAPAIEPTPKPPVIAPSPVVLEGQGGSPMRFRVAAGLTGVTAVELVSQPAMGTASVEQLDVVYAPPADFVGQASFDYRLITNEGPTSPATLTAIVHPLAAEAPVKEALASPDAPGVVELTEGVDNGPFSDAAIVSMSPSTAGTAELVRGQPQAMAPRAAPAMGKAAGRSSARAEDEGATFQLKFKPAANFYGEVEIRYALTNRFGGPTKGVVRFLVDTRDDPTRDAKVAAIVSSQAQAAGRFGAAQISNVSRRMEARRDGAASAGGIGFTSARASVDPFGDPMRERTLKELGDMLPAAHGVERPASQGAKEAENATSISVWTGGTLELGTRKAEPGAAGFDFATAGVTLGADMAVSEKVFAGVGVGAGRDRSDLGDGAEVRASAASVFAYASYGGAGSFFVDGLVGYGVLDFDTKRIASEQAVTASRSGDQMFATISAGWELTRGAAHFAPYGRLEMTHSRLKAYSEQGPVAVALAFDSFDVEQQSGVLGFRGRYAMKTELGLVEPSVRAEYVWSLRSSGETNVGYAFGSEKRYRLPLALADERRGLIGGGLRWTTEGRWIFSLDLERLIVDGGDSTTIRVGGSGSF